MKQKRSRPLKIAVSGRSGCGNSTVSGMVARRLGVTFINYTFHTMADELGITLAEVMDLAREDPSYDYQVDKKIVEVASQGSCVIGSRLAIWLVGDARLKVYLDASIFVRAQRIQKREGGSLEEILSFTRKRDDQDHERYLKLYGIDNYDYKFADLIIDTALYKPEEIAELILQNVPGRS